MHRHLSTLLALSCGTIATAWGQTPAVRTEVQTAVKRYAETANAGDISAHMELYSREAGVTSINDGTILRGWEAIRAAADEMTGQEGSYKFSVGSIDVMLGSPSLAIAVSPFVATVQTPQGPVQLRGALTLVLKKATSGWQIIHDHTSSLPADEGRE